MTAAQIVMFGTTSQARLADHFFTTDSEHDVVAFTVDRSYTDGAPFLGRPVVPFEELTDRYPPDRYAVFVALGYTAMNRLRAEKFETAKTMGYRLPSYVSSRCTYLSENEPGENCLILEDNTVQPGVTIGDDVTLWSGNHIGHDSTIGDHTFISSHCVVSGFVTIGERCFLGVNCTLRDDLTIGDRTLIGAGAVIMHDTDPDGVYLPPRATKIDTRSEDVAL